MSVVSAACAAPDEQRLGKDADYPVGKAANRDWLSGVIQYDRKPTHRFTSQSMAKSVTALAIGFALRDGYIKSLDDRVDRYATGLKGTLLGETTVRHLLRMASGARIVQTNDGTGNSGRFDTAIGAYGQFIFIDPELTLVLVQTGVKATADASGTTLHRDRIAFWRALVDHYGKW